MHFQISAGYFWADVRYAMTYGFLGVVRRITSSVAYGRAKADIVREIPAHMLATLAKYPGRDIEVFWRPAGPFLCTAPHPPYLERGGARFVGNDGEKVDAFIWATLHKHLGRVRTTVLNRHGLAFCLEGLSSHQILEAVAEKRRADAT